MENVIDPKRYSSWTKLLRVTALCIRFTEACKGKKEREELSAEEIHGAKDKWLRHLQKEVTKEEN